MRAAAVLLSIFTPSGGLSSFVINTEQPERLREISAAISSAVVGSSADVAGCPFTHTTKYKLAFPFFGLLCAWRVGCAVRVVHLLY